MSAAASTAKDGEEVFSARFSPDGTRVATGGEDGRVRVWDARRGPLLRTLAHDSGTTTALDFSPDGGQLLARNSDAPLPAAVVAVDGGLQSRPPGH